MVWRAVICFLLSQLSLRSDEVRAWRIDGSAMGVDLRYQVFPMLLHSAEYQDGIMTLRVGLKNLSEQTYFAPLPMDEEKLFLGRKVFEGARPCLTIEQTWKPEKKVKMLPGDVVSAMLRFRLDPAWLKETLVLYSATHTPLIFRLDQAVGFMPVSVKELDGKTAMLDAHLPPSSTGNRDVKMRLGQMRCADGKLTFEVVFSNIARYAFIMQECPRGGDARLIDGYGHALTGPEVRGAILDSIAPPGEWHPGEEVRGMVSFAMPHPHAAKSLWFTFPGYPPLPLMLDGKTATWKVDEGRLQTPVMTHARLLSAMEQKLFDSVTSFWKGVSNSILEGKLDAALKLFEMEKAPELFRELDKMAFESFEISPLHDQSMNLEGGELRIVGLQLKYRLKGQRGTDAFRVYMLCRMSAQQDGSWRVKALTFPDTPPFWTRGFTRVIRSPRFLVVHKDAAREAAAAQQISAELEAAYVRLIDAGLPMSATYVAFHCSGEGDFQILSGADPAMAGGAAPGYAMAEEDRIHVYNLALYANDTSYRKRHAFADRGNQHRQMLQHELVHLATGDWTRAWTPAWLIEGVAEYFGGGVLDSAGDLLAAQRSGISLRDLSLMGHLPSGSPDLLSLHQRYQLSTLAVAWLAKTYGEASLLKFYSAYAGEFPALWGRGGRIDYSDEDGPAKRAERLKLTELMLEKHLGIKLEQLELEVWKAVQREARAR